MVKGKIEPGYRNENILNLVAGLLIGSLAGALLMILLTRQSSRMTRDQIWQKGINFRGRIVGTFDDLRKLTYYDNRQIPAGIRVRTDFRTPQTV